MTSQSPDLENEIHNFLRQLARRFFETEWDIEAFAIIFIFVGTVLSRCSSCLSSYCCDCDSPKQCKVPRRKVAIENLALES